MIAAGMKSLALCFPRKVRGNDYFRRKHPAMVARAEQMALATPWSIDDPTLASHAFDAEMAKFLHDPFRGTRERRILEDGQSGLSIELQAAREALALAGLRPEQVGAAVVASFPADQPGVGNGAFIARELGLQCAAWNLETACSGSMIGFQTACALVQSGQVENVLVVVSCTYSKVFDDDSVLSWTIGDGATAFVVGREREGRGWLGGHSVHTAGTIGAFYFEYALDEVGRPRVHVGGDKAAGKVLRDTSEHYVRTCCEGAAKSAGLRLDQLDFFVFNTPIASFASFATRVLGVDKRQTVNAFPYCGNVGPVLTNSNLYLAARTGRIKPDDRVMVYSIGSTSSASAAVVRWGDVSLGAEPDGMLAACSDWPAG